MSRIRTIKPEFPQSETIGKLSREARLLFILLWTIADDAGRARAASRMLASLLYPYDDDAPNLIEGWLSDLERADCIRRYDVDGARYLEITNWLKHQKIDRPSKSRLPAFDEGSPSPREHSRDLDADLGPRTLDQDLGPDSGARAPRPIIDDPFSRFWSVYPKREGSNPKKPAKSKFEKLVRDGADPEAITAGARRYADELAAQNKIHTIYVAQAITWLNQERWKDTEPSKQTPVATLKVFLTEDDPRHRVWVKHLIATRGRGPFVTERESDRKRGSYFDSESPPSLPENELAA
jgi:hypothetical protein